MKAEAAFLRVGCVFYNRDEQFFCEANKELLAVKNKVVKEIWVLYRKYQRNFYCRDCFDAEVKKHNLKLERVDDVVAEDEKLRKLTNDA